MLMKLFVFKRKVTLFRRHTPHFNVKSCFFSRTPASNRHTAAIRHHPPTHRGLMNARRLARGTRSFFAEGSNVGGFDCFPHPERGLRYGFRPLIPSVACIPVIAYSEHFWPRLRCSPLRLKNAASFGSIDCSLHSLQSSVTSLASCGFTAASTPCGHKLSSHFHSHFTPDTSGYAYGVGFVPITVCPETSACYSGLSTPCRRAPSYGRRKSAISTFLPPAEVAVLAVQSARFLHYTPTPGPDGRCADALTTLRQTATNALNAYGSAAQVPVIGYILAPIAAAMAVAAGAIQIATIKKQQQASEAQGYSEGGFTTPGRKDEPVGTVHAGEWVASQKLVNNSRTRPLLEALDYA